jgi:hypothetical protein
MAGHGPAPKDPAKRRRRNAEPKPLDTLASDGRTRGPALPEGVLPDGEEWHERTRAWWATWRKSAQAQAFTPTDWDFLLDTALMHHTMWSKQRWEFAAELRLRAGKFGATPEDRLRLRMQIDPQPKAPARRAEGDGSVTDISSRRSRLAE